jgi:hypothetical protein
MIMASVKILLAQVNELPPVCVCCGQPATRVRPQEFRVNEALSAAVLAGAALVGGLAWTERGVTLTLPVCEYHRRRGRKSNRTLAVGLGLTAVLGAAAYLASVFDGRAASYLAVAAMFAFMVTLFVGMHEVNDGLGVRGLTAGSLTLTGVHRKFAEAFRAIAAGGPSTPR